MLPEVITATIDMPPVAWNRPAGKGVRYDSQVADKAAFSVKFLQDVYKMYPALRDAPKPWFPTENLTVIGSFFFKNDTARLKKDLDNMVKFILDAMQSQMLDGVIWKDDRQVDVIQAQKCLHVADAIIVSIQRTRP